MRFATTCMLCLMAGLIGFGMFASASDKKVEKPVTPSAKLETAILAGGCFWCVESTLEKVKGVKSAVSGYTGGVKPNPAYKEVARGMTKHREAVEVVFDPAVVSYEEVLEAFWRIINPTDAGGSFHDRGHHYTSAIYYLNESQKAKAEASKAAVAKLDAFKKPIATEVLPAKPFYRAEEYHQDYYKKNKIRYWSYRKGSGRDAYTARVWDPVPKGFWKTK